jgi:hypothetical protein
MSPPSHRPTLWNPYTTLRINPRSETTCIGKAIYKGRRCGCRVAKESRKEAIRTLDDAALLHQSSQETKNKLEELAPLLLCKRFHQEQKSEVISLWLSAIRQQTDSLINLPDYEAAPTPSVALVSPPASPASTRARRQHQIGPSVDTTQQEVAHPPHLDFSTAAASSPSTPRRRDRLQRRPSVIATREEVPELPSSVPIAEIPLSSNASSSVTREITEQDEPETEETVDEHSVVRGRDGDCGICTESIRIGENVQKCLQCNNCLHSDCLGQWREASPSTSCPYW